MFRRKKGLVLKIIIGIPLAWFCLVGMTVVLTGQQASVGQVDRLPRETDDKGRDLILKNQEGHKPKDFQPQAAVLEQPNPDWIRFQEKMQQDAAESLRLREAEIARVKHKSSSQVNPLVFAPAGNPASLGAGDDQPSKPMGMKSVYRIPNKPEVPEFDASHPGENGKGMNVDKSKLSPEELKKYEQGFQRNAFNQYVSDKMSLHRTLPDVRDKECLDRQYMDNLPDTSIIVIFHNEAYSVLLRTVFSCLDRSPPHLVREIVLVDDFSDFDHLKSPLDEFVNGQEKVRLVRAKKREGLIRARLLGASVAQGTVLTFLDSHCECTMGWLEPLLDRIAQNKSNVVTPVIDVINDETIQYQYSSAKATSVGGFDWNLQFNWHGIPDHERRRRKSDVDPVRSPTMAGGLFSISREYFEYLGTYDPGMDIWGGENLELSFRIWMCGGTLFQVLCSHVGHIFRKRSPYSHKNVGNPVKKNSIRLAEVWMDEYKDYYYERFNYDLTWMCGGTLEIVPCSHVGHIFRKRSPYSWKTGGNVLKKNSIRVAEVWMDEYKNYYYERFNHNLIWMCGGNLEVIPCSHIGHIFRKRNPTTAIKSKQNPVRKNTIRMAEVWMDSYKNFYFERIDHNLIWMCGGSLEIVPCSHVGHIFRKRSPYSWKTGVNVVKKNSVRLAEVWLDEFSKYYYERFNFDLGDYGDVSSRKALRERLHCKSFKWYLDNIYPDLFIPGESLASGEIRNKVNGMFNGQPQPACLDSPADKKAYNKAIKLWPCHNMGGNQYWMLSKSGEIRRDEGCFDYAGQFVMIYPCHGMKGNQEWIYGPDNTLRHKNTNLCIELSEDGTKIEMKACTGIDRQIFYWKRKLPDSEAKKYDAGQKAR